MIRFEADADGSPHSSRVEAWLWGLAIYAERLRLRNHGHLCAAERIVYLWRAVDAEGEVLDVLVQSKRMLWHVMPSAPGTNAIARLVWNSREPHI